MAKKIYDIIPPKVDGENITKTLKKVRKPRKKLDASLVMPEPFVRPIAKPIQPDILPPKNVQSVDNFSAISQPSVPLQPQTPPAPANLTDKKTGKKKPLLLGFSAVLILAIVSGGIYLYITLPWVDIQILPKTETLSFADEININTKADVVDLEKKIIPARYVEVQKEFTQEFLATSNASNDVRATGTIKIYNKISPATSFVLKSGTHFLSDSGKYFVTLEKLTIPAAKYEKGKLVANFIEAKVQAEEVGPDQNIKASKFSIPKLSGTEYYYVIWGESDNAMTGGYLGTVKKVSKDDIEQAKDTLAKSLLTQAEDSLKKDLLEGEVLLDNSIVKNVVSSAVDVKPDAVTDKFNASVKVKISALVFKKQDIEKIAKEYIFNKLSYGKTFLDESLKIEYTPKVVDVSGGSGAFDLQLSAIMYEDVNLLDLVDFLNNKSSDQISEIVNRMYSDGVLDVKTKFWPFWVNKSPKDKNRINIDLSFE